MRKFVTFIFILCLLTSSHGAYVVHAQTPISFVRRAEAIMILLKNAGVPVEKTAETGGTYPDILDGEWYVPYVIKGLDMDMIDVERETGLVYPHRSVTRAEFLKMMSKAFELTTDIPYQYTDIPEQAWYTRYVGLSWRYTLFNGVGSNDTLQPERLMTHSEATQAIYKLLSAEPSLQPTPNMFPVAKEPPPEKVGFFQTLIEALRPRSAKVEPEQPSSPASDPRLVKNTMLKLIRSRENQADYTKNELVEAVNNVRASYNLDPVRSNYYLDLAAQRHAKDMADRGYFSHYTPEGLSYVDRIRGAGYLDVDSSKCTCPQQFLLGDENQKTPNFTTEQDSCKECEPAFAVGENLAKGQLSVEQVMEDWLNSPNHRKNILRPQFSEMGVGLFGDLWVQEFGHLKAQ